jgi:hypothetical protein
MSAIDSGYQKQEDPKGDRVVVIMNGKFCPTKVVKRTVLVLLLFTAYPGLRQNDHWLA